MAEPGQQEISTIPNGEIKETERVLTDYWTYRMLAAQNDPNEFRKIAAQMASTTAKSSDIMKKYRDGTYIDTLTGIPNEASFDLRYEALASSNKPFALVLGDLKQFKLVNDTFGHQAGDDVLKDVAKTLLKSTRQDREPKGLDYVFRLHGDEWAMCLTGIEKEEDLEKTLERIHKTVMTSPVTSDFHEIPVMINLGGGILRPGQNRVEHRIRVDKEALYASKTSGKPVVLTPNKAA